MTSPHHWIEGEEARFEGEAVADVRSPWTGGVVGSVPVGGDASVDAALASASRAYRTWRRTALDERLTLVDALADRAEREAARLVDLLVAEVGKPVKAARLEVRNTVASLRYFRELAARHLRDRVAVGDGTFTPRVALDPVGVVAAITPFNFPLQLLSWKLCPAVLAGCTVVCKPDPRTPLSTAALARFASELGWPPGVFDVVHGDGATGARLIGDPRVAKVAFTGSVAAGREVYERAASGIKRVTLELGGCSPLVVCDDADIAGAMPHVLHRAFYNSGQYCFRINRALVHRSRCEEFTEAFAEAATGLAAGDPADERTDLGPLIDRPSFEGVVARVEDAARRGARVVLDGRSVAREGGSLLGPTLLDAVPDGADVLRRETFGPVVAVVPFDSLDEALDRANATEYGLAAFALTRDPRVGERLCRELEAGTVWVNALDKTVIDLPFGGVKRSGVGVEKSTWGFDAYVQPRAIYYGFPDAVGNGGPPERGRSDAG